MLEKLDLDDIGWDGTRDVSSMVGFLLSKEAKYHSSCQSKLNLPTYSPHTKRRRLSPPQQSPIEPSHVGLSPTRSNAPLQDHTPTTVEEWSWSRCFICQRRSKKVS